MITHETIDEQLNKKEKLVCITASLVIVASSIISIFSNTIRLFIRLPFKLDTIFIYGIILTIVLLSVKTILKRSTISLYIMISFLLLTYLISSLINSRYNDYFNNLGIDFLIYSVPWLIVTFSVRDYKLYKRYLYISGILILVSFIMNLYVYKIDMVSEAAYSQYYTYMLLPTAIILADALFDKISFLNITLFIVTVIFMFSMGSRGPIACVFVFFILKNLLIFKLDFRKMLIRIMPILTVLTTVYFFYLDILSYLLSIFQKMNYSTRTVIRLMEGTFFKDNARNLLIKNSIDQIKKYPFTGVGLGKDRIILALKMGSNNLLSEVVGWYPHNIFLELLLHFGVFIGGALILCLIIFLFLSVFKNTNRDMSDIICIYIGAGFLPLLFSGSYIESPLFFALLGFCLNWSYNKNLGSVIVN